MMNCAHIKTENLNIFSLTITSNNMHLMNYLLLNIDLYIYLQRQVVFSLKRPSQSAYSVIL